MEPQILTALVVVAIAGVVAVVVISRHLAARRREALAAAALGLGFEFLPTLAAHEVAPGGLRILTRGRGHSFRNLLRGRRGDTAVLVADHDYTTGSGKNSSHHRRSLLVLRRTGLALPTFYLRPQIAVLDSIGKMVGMRDLDFSEDEAFSRAFLLQTDEEDAVRRLFGAAVRQQALALGRAFEVEARGDVLLVERTSRVAAVDVPQLVDNASAFLEVLAGGVRSTW